MTPTELVLSRLSDVSQKSEKQWIARCPGHDDSKPSLSVGVGDDGGCLIHCHAGCYTVDVARKIGLTILDLIPGLGTNGFHSLNGNVNGNGLAKKPRAKIVATYNYCDEAGIILYRKHRYEPKSFSLESPLPDGKWAKKLPREIRRVLYRTLELVAAIAKHPTHSPLVFIVEGEKDAERLAAAGFTTTTNFEGASKSKDIKSKWLPEYSDQLAGCHLIIVPDNDESGIARAEAIARSCNGKVASIKILILPNLPPKGDGSDWLDAGGTAEELLRLAEAAPVWKQAEDADELPEIKIGPYENLVNDQAVEAIARDQSVFCRGNSLVHIVNIDGDQGKDGIHRIGIAPRIRKLPNAIVRECLVRNALFTKFDGEVDEHTHPPRWCIEAVESRGIWPNVRRLEGVANWPLMLPDGNVFSTPGYNAILRLYLSPDSPSVPIALVFADLFSQLLGMAGRYIRLAH